MSCHRLIIINPFGIGDVLFSTPLISTLKKSNFALYIGYICNLRTSDLLKTNPNIDEVFIFEKDEYRALWRNSKIKAIRKFYNFFQEIKKRKFDIAIDLSLSRHYSFFMWLLGIPKRIGYNYKNRGALLNFKLDIEGYESKHIVEYYLGLLKFFEIAPVSKKLEFYISKADKSWAEDFLYRNHINKDGIIIGIVPGGGESWGKTAEYKQWSYKNFGILARRLIESFGIRVIILGGQSDTPICNYIESMASGCVNIAGRTSLREFAAILGKCNLVICNDGGPLHVAVSQGVRTVSIFGPVDEKVYGPFPSSNRHIVITSKIDCRPCYRRFKIPICNTRQCLKDISVDEVFNAVAQLIGQKEADEPR